MMRNLALGIVALTGLLAGCAEQADADRDRNVQSVVRQHTDVWSEGNLALIPDIYAEDYVGHFPGGETVTGRDGIRAFVEAHRVSFPDWNEVIVDTIAEGDRVVTRYQSTGTHEGEFLGIPPTGVAVDIPEASVYRMVDGKIAEQWAFPDVASLQSQLSVGRSE